MGVGKMGEQMWRREESRRSERGKDALALGTEGQPPK